MVVEVEGERRQERRDLPQRHMYIRKDRRHKKAFPVRHAHMYLSLFAFHSFVAKLCT
jgi:hypothetical protein